jgi:hypothetical protein
MPTPSAISPLEQFRKEFPFLEWIVDDPVLCYPFRDEHWTARAEEKARRLIIAKKLPLIASSEFRWFGKSYRHVLIISNVPEEYTFQDEAQDDEGLTGGWWDEFERSLIPF